MKRHEAQLHSSETPYKCRCSYHWYCYWCIEVFWILTKASLLFSRCDRTFKSEYSWKRHQSNDEVHEKMENYKPFLTCEVPNHITPSKKLLKEFFTTHAHLLGTLPILTLVSSHLPIQVCGKQFERRRRWCLDQHMLSHETERKFKCDICEKYFRNSSYLKTHRKACSGVKVCQCSDAVVISL